MPFELLGLETDFLMNYLAGRQFFYDDFIGAVLDNRWAKSGDIGGNAVITTRSKVLITTAAVANNAWRINWNGKKGIYVGKFPKFYTKVTPTGTPDLEVRIGLYKDANNYFHFYYDPAITLTWRIKSIAGGVPTDVNTGVTFVDLPTELMIDVVSANAIAFYINGNLTNTITTNIPATVDVEPQFGVETLVAGAVSLAIDNVIISADPE